MSILPIMFLERLYLMVDLFFVLSGFVMCHVYGKIFETGVRRSELRKYLAARFARIYPLHFVVLVFLIGLALIIQVASHETDPLFQLMFDFSELPSHFFLLHGLDTAEFDIWNGSSWSISTEWWMYLAFPFLAGLISRGGRLRVACVVLVCVTIYCVIALVIEPNAPLPVFVGARYPMSLRCSGILRCAAGFVLGMATFRVYSEKWLDFFSGGWLLLCLVGGVIYCLAFGFPDIVTVCFFPGVVVLLARASPRLCSFLGAKPLERLGDWSYAIYMSHIPVYYVLVAIMNGLSLAAPSGLTKVILLGLYFSITIAVSILLYSFVEIPLRRIVKNMLV